MMSAGQSGLGTVAGGMVTGLESWLTSAEVNRVPSRMALVWAIASKKDFGFGAAAQAACIVD